MNNTMTLTGAYCKDCKIFTTNVEPEALKLIYSIINHPVFEDAKIRIMPDVHAGKGIVIGFSCPITKAVNPSHVGCDIGCRMSTYELESAISVEDYPIFEHKLKSNIPMGFNLNDGISAIKEKMLYIHLKQAYDRARSAWPEMIPEVGTIDEKYIKKLCQRVGMDLGVFFRSLGTVGGGNHFIEYGEANGAGFVTVHCGSRNFGVKVFNYWNKIANNHKINKEQLRQITETIKATEPDKTKWKDMIQAAKEELTLNQSNGYLYGDELRGYLSDMVIAQAYAEFNHEVIQMTISNILQSMHNKIVYDIHTTHNYIDFYDHIIRKGAINASRGVTVIIPFNMRDGIMIGLGKGNEEWNCTAPHGAGRIMSRSKAKKELDVDIFKNEMKNVYSTTVCEGTLDESPMAYKDTQEIISLIGDTVEPMFFIQPKINIKATDGCD